ncbi:uncharacterized protein DMAD_07698 [Drosophila madeirensis]|uniref:Uncharacterized protein n=1 Tax=Drosophila madeirensis TaxID=30013 RepID=A0AAU9F771_DROMD
MNAKAEDRLIELLNQELVERFTDDRLLIRNEVRQNIQQAQKNYKDNFDKKRRVEHGYRVGDLVAVKRTQFVAVRKLASSYLGPYEIVKVKRNGRYDVKKAALDVEGTNVTTTSWNNLKLLKFVDENEELLSSGTDDDCQEGRM